MSRVRTRFGSRSFSTIWNFLPFDVRNILLNDLLPSPTQNVYFFNLLVISSAPPHPSASDSASCLPTLCAPYKFTYLLKRKRTVKVQTTMIYWLAVRPKAIDQSRLLYCTPHRYTCKYKHTNSYVGLFNVILCWRYWPMRMAVLDYRYLLQRFLRKADSWPEALYNLGSNWHELRVVYFGTS